MNKLKPCPFCGGTAKKVYKSSGQTIHIECEQCRAQFPKSTNENAYDEAWNSRAERTCCIEYHYGEWYCHACGQMVGTCDTASILHIDGNAIELWGYCPMCGAKVVG